MDSFPLFTQALSVLPENLLWLSPSVDLGTAPEKILVFETIGGRPLTLVSNYPYELWLDGQFAGDGGHRCTQGEALADYWEAAATSTLIQVRLHWLDVKQTSVLYRCLFEDAFFAEIPSSGPWTCSQDHLIQFAAQSSAQLPRQNILLSHSAEPTPVELQPAALSSPWKILPPFIQQAHYIPLEPKLHHTHLLQRQQPGTFDPEISENIALYVRDQRPCDLQCDTYDLGQIALHRFEINTYASACVLYYSEVANFEDVANTRFRAKVHLADAIGAEFKKAAPFGQRGCRYIHVLYPATNASRPTIEAWRREYPLQWKTTQPLSNTPASNAILSACRTNLIACIDGGAVDTCWRERAQWTGDLRMSAMALRALTHNLEVVDLALHQIAQSYNPGTGLVQGAWPIQNPQSELPIPPFHLAFCLTALEHDSELKRDPVVRQVVHDSFTTWQRLYFKNGLIQGMPGWYFTDWDYSDPVALGRDENAFGPHAVCNAWWSEWCDLMAPEAAIHPEIYDKAFWMGQAYALTTDKSRDSPHATATALNCSVGQYRIQEGLDYLETEIAAQRLTSRVTPYFAYFVARAFRHRSQTKVLQFIEEFYGPMAQTYGSIYEKTSDEASLAHGWSMGVAALVIQ